ncbi:hypothetical protein [Arcobacter sp. LA11]|uniref:hypothetical protein n=1 Tax=Arcobacter sp. LA11 TaxID=1898176 RepID=UPI0009349790|nr:hypothetical protein [Arcobacter sp. LA11]
MVNSINTIMYNLDILNDRNNKVNHGLSTNEALEYGSDDSIRYDYILGVKNDINIYTSINESINYNTAFNTSSDTALAEIKSVTESILSELIKANTDTTSDEGRVVIAGQVEDYKQSLLSLSNTSVDNQYLFSGVNTDINPFLEDETTGEISYQSDNSLKQVNVEENRYVSQGVNGIDVFYYTNNSVENTDGFTFSSNEIILDEDGNEWKLMDSNNDGTSDGLFLNGDITSSSMLVTDNGDGTFSAVNTSSRSLEIKHSIFDDLNEVISALKLEDEDGNTISKGDASVILSVTLENIDTAYDSQNISHSIVGTRTNTINTYQDIVQTKLTNLTILENEYASADLTALAVEAQALENTYSALYSTINRVNSLSLINYLK